MASYDQYLLGFVRENLVSLTLLLGFLKLLAKRSKTNLDDSILGYFGEFLGGFKRKPEPSQEGKEDG